MKTVLFVISLLASAAEASKLLRSSSLAASQGKCPKWCASMHSRACKLPPCFQCDMCVTTTTPTTTKPCIPTTAPIAIADTHTVEMGRVAISGFHWKTFQFDKAFPAIPVVSILIRKPGPHPAAIRIKDVTTTSFAALIVEPPKEPPLHLSQSVSYLAVSPGKHTLPDGRSVVAGVQSLSARVMGGKAKCQPSPDFSAWDTLKFPSTQFKKPPMLLTQLQTNNNEDKNVPRQTSWPWMTVATTDVTTAGAKVAIDRSETAKSGVVDVAETLGFIAIEPGEGEFTSSNGIKVKYAAVVTGNDIRGMRDRPRSVVKWGIDLGARPLVVGSMSTRNGGDGGWLRFWRASRKSAWVYIDEDRTCDREKKHPEPEVVSIFAVSSGFTA